MPIETFHTQIARNKRNSVILIAGFLAFFILFGLLIGAVWGGVRNAPAKTTTASSSEVGVDVTGNSVGQPMVTTPPPPEVSFWDRINWPFSITIACLAGGVAFLLTLGTYFRGGDALLSISHAHELSKSADPQLFNVVEELSLAAGTPMPKIYVIHDSAMNAFATGRGPKHASVAITTGLREKLTRDELQGVMAHELSHVRHYDILYATMMAVLVGMVVILADIFLRSVFWGAAGRRRSSSRDSGGGAIQIVLIVIAVILAILAPILAKIIQMALSRQREYLADSGAVELTRNPDGLAGALAKLSGDREILEAANRATAPMYIVQPILKMRDHQKAGLFDTHPPISDRIRRLKNLGA